MKVKIFMSTRLKDPIVNSSFLYSMLKLVLKDQIGHGAWGVIETKTFGLVYIKKNRGRSLVEYSANSQANLKAIK